MRVLSIWLYVQPHNLKKTYILLFSFLIYISEILVVSNIIKKQFCQTMHSYVLLGGSKFNTFLRQGLVTEVWQHRKHQN